MGSNSSKSTSETAVHVQKSEDPEGIANNSDPRSPTPEIIRTPLQSKNGGKHNITKNADLRKTFENGMEEKLIHNNPILSAVIKNHLQSYDPRSPTQEFERTPIVITSKIDELDAEKTRLRQENTQVCGSPSLQQTQNNILDNSYSDETQYDSEVVPKNLCDIFFDMTFDDTLKEPVEPLGSSTASQDSIENNIHEVCGTKPTKLLETNFEYIEHNLDNTDCTLQTSINDYSQEKLDTQPQFEVLENDPRSPSVGIERTPIVVTKFEMSCDGNVEEMSDDTLIKALQNTNADFRQTIANTLGKNKDGLLIYEDETTNLVNTTPKKSKLPESCSGYRTPLSCMKNKTDATHVRSKSANTFDPKSKSLPASKRVSHIPRLKSLSKPLKYTQAGSLGSLKSISKTSAVSGDCENTPPHSQRDIWDKDNSVVL